MSKYYYWHCRKCGRYFQSFRSGGKGVECVCGDTFNVVGALESEYKTYIKKEMERK